jgi:hypothetical protein
MTSANALAILPATSVAGCGMRVSQSEKSRGGNGLGAGGFPQNGAKQKQSTPLASQGAFHSGTGSRARFHDAPRINAAFAAQALGQAMGADGAGRDTQSALAAYERNHILGKGGWLFDDEA